MKHLSRRERGVIGALLLGGVAFSSLARAEPMDWQGLPEDAGREEVFYTCQACHSLALVKQQALNRRTWDTLFDWMITEKGMPAPDQATRDRMLDYLAAHFGPRPTPGGVVPGGMPPISTMRP